MKATENLSGDRGREHKPASGSDFGGHHIVSSPQIPPAVADRARRYVAALSRDADDARHLLETLGLLELTTRRRRPRKGMPK